MSEKLLRYALLILLVAGVGLFGCDDKPADGDGDADGDADEDADTSGDNEYEGDDPGECDDGADNDRDLLFDCDDEGCAGSPACRAGDADADIDEDGDDCLDLDGDGYCRGEDCDDTDRAVNPGASDLCNNFDDDCDPETPDGSSEDWFGNDCDGDDADLCEEGTLNCVDGAQRCNDDTGDSNETCDGEDNDCDGEVDEGVGTLFFRDYDGDGFGELSREALTCESPPEGYIANSSDCDDTDVTVNPDASEDCDGVDNNCDGSVDEGCTCELGDIQECGEGGDEGECGWGVQECIAVETDSQWGECIRDEDQRPHPETCDGLDNDCDGEVDEVC